MEPFTIRPGTRSNIDKNGQACKVCPVRHLCTVNKNGRFIERSIYQEALEENQKRVGENPEYYRLGQQIAEHQFGTLKRQWGSTHTLMKGKRNVLSEVNLIMICYNLKRIMAILHPKELKTRLKELIVEFFAISGPFSTFMFKYVLGTTPLHIEKQVGNLHWPSAKSKLNP